MILSSLWSKVWFDLWEHPGRTGLSILNIAAGVFCVGVLFGMIDLQLAKMDQAHINSSPSEISLIVRQDLDKALIQEIKQFPNVSVVDVMVPVTVSYKRPSDDAWTIGTLMVRPEPSKQQLDRTVLVSGEWPKEGQIAIENLSQQFSHYQLGQRIELMTQAGFRSFEISAIVRHPFIKPPRFGGQIHFFADSQYAESFGLKPDVFRQLLIKSQEPFDLDNIRTLTQKIHTLLAGREVDVIVTLLQDPFRHWGRPFIEGIDYILQVMAVVSMLLASVLMINSVSAHINHQFHQIGIMKALGGSTVKVATLYLTEVFVMSLLAVLIAVPPALYLASLSACRLLGLFNVDCAEFDFSLKAVFYMFIGGLLVPFLATLWPVLKGARMTVREAMAKYGIGTDYGRGAFDHYVEKVGERFVSTVYAVALGNLFRMKTRLFLTQSVLIIAGVMVVVLSTLIVSLNLTLDNEMSRSRYTVRLGFMNDQEPEKIRSVLGDMGRETVYEFWQRSPVLLFKDGQLVKQRGSLGTQLIALPVEGELYEPLIEKGRWFNVNDRLDKSIVISAETAELNHVDVGDSVSLKLGTHQDNWEIIGVYRWLAGNNFTVEPVYASAGAVKQVTAKDAKVLFSLIRTPLKSIEEEDQFLKDVQKAFLAQGIYLDVYTTQTKLHQRQFARNQFQSVIGTLVGLTAMVMAVGGLGLSGAMSISVIQRTREFAVLRSIGATDRIIFRLIMIEGLFYGILAWLITVPVAYLFAKPVSAELGQVMLGIRLDYRFDFLSAVFWLGMVLVLAFLASYIPAKNAAKLTVREALAR